MRNKPSTFNVSQPKHESLIILQCLSIADSESSRGPVKRMRAQYVRTRRVSFSDKLSVLDHRSSTTVRVHIYYNSLSSPVWRLINIQRTARNCNAKAQRRLSHKGLAVLFIKSVWCTSRSDFLRNVREHSCTFLFWLKKKMSVISSLINFFSCGDWKEWKERRYMTLGNYKLGTVIMFCVYTLDSRWGLDGGFYNEDIKPLWMH